MGLGVRLAPATSTQVGHYTDWATSVSKEWEQEGGKERQRWQGENINPLNPTCHVMHDQFNIQQLYVLPTLYLCVLYLSENKQRLVPLTA